MMVPFLTHPSIACTHGFFTRIGGVSTGSYASLNCGLGSGDAIDNVNENHRQLCAAFSAEQNALLFCKQIHSNKVITVSKAWHPDDRPEADALVTKEKGLVLAVMSADCAPVLFCDAGAGVIGAAHAGWKGALAGILEETIGAMQCLGASAANIRAVIGPCIQQQSYEVGPEFPMPFLAQDKMNERFFLSSPLPQESFGREGSGVGLINQAHLLGDAEQRAGQHFKPNHLVFPTPPLTPPSRGGEFVGSLLDHISQTNIRPRYGHLLFDLPAYALHRLTLLGIGDVQSLGIDTLVDAARFFSYRRTTLNKEPRNGVQMSAIKLA